MQRDAGAPGPEEHRLAGQLRAIVTDDDLGQSAGSGQPVQFAGQTKTGDREVDHLVDAFA